MSPHKFGRQAQAVEEFIDIIENLTEDQWIALGKRRFCGPRDNHWKPVVKAKAKTPISPPMANALDLAGAAAGGRAARVDRSLFGSRHEQYAAGNYPGTVVFILANRHKLPSWVTRFALEPLQDIGVDVEHLIPEPEPDEEPIPDDLKAWRPTITPTKR